MSEPVDWAALELALVEWLTGSVVILDGEASAIVDNVVWEDQNIPQPAYPYASLKVTSLLKEGGGDELRNDTDDARDEGVEVRLLNTSPILLNLSIQFHLDPSPRSGATRAGETAMAFALTAQSSLGQPSVLQHLSEANLALVKELGVRDLSLVINGEWLSKAVLDLQLRTTATMTQYTGYIDKVGLVNEYLPGGELVLDSTEE
jgi:hypothetical protein